MSPGDLSSSMIVFLLEKFKPQGTKENLVITVSTVSDSVVRRKRLETFVEASTYLPDVKFVLIGKHENQSVNHLKSMAGSNLMFTGFVPDENLLPYYQRAKVYCQLSAHEGFKVAIAEAMSCCCILVTTRSYGIPEIVGDTGFLCALQQPKNNRRGY